MIEVMDERATSIRLEPPGTEGDGVEFWLSTNDSVEYHQVKRQQAAHNSWSLTDLNSKGVLTAFEAKLRISSAVCIFVSSLASPELQELADRSQGAADFEEFEREFLKASQHNRNFRQLQIYWNHANPADTYKALHRVQTRTIDESFLRNAIEIHLNPLVDGEPALASDCLSQFCLQKVHHELTAHDIWQHLETHGFRRREWHKDRHVLSAVAKANQRYLFSVQHFPICDSFEPRQETQQILSHLSSTIGTQVVLILGAAGTGKSIATAQVIETVRTSGWPLLAFRVDRLNRTSLPSNVGSQLDLPESPSIVLAALAQNRDCLLVIDQLDAVSLASGRHPDFFECINEIIQQARTYPKMHVLLSCRKFDVENDHRLQSVKQKAWCADVEIGLFSREVVEAILSRLGVGPQRLTEQQKNLLGLPLHMLLFAEIITDPAINTIGLTTANDLYDHFWKRKQQIIRERLGRDIRWTEMIDALCADMDAQQSLSSPKLVLDVFNSDPQVMISEHVLTLDNGRYSFFHEGFFDYCFARRFIAKGGSLQILLSGDQQHLFRRAQVRQILLQERETYPDRYLQDLGWLLSSSDVRFQIKQLVWSLIAAIRDPSDGEWSIVSRVAAVPMSVEARQLHLMLSGSVGWVRFLDSKGLIEQWLQSDDPAQVDRTVILLTTVQKEMSDRIAEIIEPYLNRGDSWRNRLIYAMHWCDIGASRRFFDLFLMLLDNGILDDAVGPIASNADFWLLLGSLAEQQPAWTCETIGHYLNRRLRIAADVGRANPFIGTPPVIPNSQSDDRMFFQAATGAPAVFVEQVMPAMLQILRQTATGDNPPLPDPIWQFRWRGQHNSIADALLAAMETAVLAPEFSNVDIFSELISSLRNEPYETIQFLLIRAYSANAQSFGDEALGYLCDEPRRFNIGYADCSLLPSMQLIKAASPYCSAQTLTRLEDTILALWPIWEQLTSHGYSQFKLLNSIDASRLSARATRRLEEHRRKFSDAPGLDSNSGDGFFAAPPVPAEAATKMSDDQWLGALAKYDHDFPGMSRSGEIVGGASQLASLLQEQTRQFPERFSELLQRFPQTTAPVYFGKVLMGLAEANVSQELLLRTCERLHKITGRPCGLEIARAIARFRGSVLLDALFDILSWYAIEDPDPPRDLWTLGAEGTPAYNTGDVLAVSLSCVRGFAALTIAELVYGNKDNTTKFTPLIEKMVVDPSIAVRCSVIEALRALLYHRNEISLHLFLTLIGDEVAVLGTNPAERFLIPAGRFSWDSMEPVLRRMLADANPEVLQSGARVVCVISTFKSEAEPLAVEVLGGGQLERLAAARVYSETVWAVPPDSFVENALINLLQDPDQEVQKQAADCFRVFKGELSERSRLIDAFVESAAFPTNDYFLLHDLTQSTSLLPEASVRVCKRVLDAAAPLEQSAAGTMMKVSALLLRTYTQTKAEVIRLQCLDLIDQMLRDGAYDVIVSLDLLDR